MGYLTKNRWEYITAGGRFECKRATAHHKLLDCKWLFSLWSRFEGLILMWPWTRGVHDLAWEVIYDNCRCYIVIHTIQQLILQFTWLFVLFSVQWSCKQQDDLCLTYPVKLILFFWRTPKNINRYLPLFFFLDKSCFLLCTGKYQSNLCWFIHFTHRMMFILKCFWGIHDPQRKMSVDFGDPLDFPLTPLAVWDVLLNLLMHQQLIG